MTAIVSAYAGATGLRRRCVYCTIVVGEAVALKHGIESEPFTETADGPVCENCRPEAQKIAKARAQAALAMNKRLTPYGRDVRNARILHMRNNGMSYLKIAAEVGLSSVYVGKILSVMRARARIDDTGA